jgi:Spy/CpxP family protein refolding chaperone
MKIGRIVRLAVLAGGLLMAGMANAQQRQMKTPEQRADHQARWMEKNLALTPEQNKKVYKVLLAHTRQMEDLRNQPRSSQKRASVADEQQQFDRDMRLILTADQYKGYKAHMEEMRARAKDRRGGGDMPPPPPAGR